MEFYVTMLPPIIGSLYMLWYLRRLGKHDRVLYKFCQTRRDLMSLLREENYNLRRQDYTALKYLSLVTDSTIHHFNEYKKSRFNARRLYEELKFVKRVEKRIKRKVITNEQVGELHRQFSLALISAFFAFTPFLTSEIVLRLMPFLVKVLAIAGLRYFRDNARRITEAVSWAQEEKRALAA